MRRSLAALSALALAAPGQAQDGLAERVTSLEEELALMRDEQAASKGRSGYDDGFFVENTDGSWRVKLGGLFQVNGLFYDTDLHDRDNRVELRRMRLELTGELGPVARFALEPKLTELEFEFEEAWIGAQLHDTGALLQLGRMKEPFGLEEFTSRKHIDFVEYSLLNQLSPAEDTGVFLFGELASGVVGYGLGLTSATGAGHTVSDEGVSGRLVLKPFATSQRGLLEGLQVGAAATWGEADQDVSGDSLNLETRDAFLTFEPGSSFDGERTRLGLETAWYGGPVALQAETLWLEQEVSGSLGSGENSIDGWTASASWVLTGEGKTWGGVHPSRPVLEGVRPTRPALGGGGSGAWQLAVRYSDLDLGDELVAFGLAAPSAFPGSVDSLDIGVNWYLTYDFVLKFHWVHSRYGMPVTFGSDTRDSEDALFMQAQMTF